MSGVSAVQATESPPLVVDLDGSLTPTDTLIESIIRLVRSSPWMVFRLPLWLLRGRASFRQAITSQVNFSADDLPFHEALLKYLRDEKSKGRRLVLATTAHRNIAEAVSMRLGIFDAVLASDDQRNLQGPVKLQDIKTHVGPDFVYAGHHRDDLPIWKAARAAVLVGVSARVGARVRRDTLVERDFSAQRVGLSVWLRALRAHQWSKNALLFVPMLTSFSFLDIGRLASIGIAFLSFSLLASATYIANDLWDLDNDRAHARKRLRPFASAHISIVHGLIAAAAMSAVAFLLAAVVSWSFFTMLSIYFVLTTSYSLVFKEYVLIDVLVLSLLYTLRILAGSVAVGVQTSTWLLAFSVFMFLSLALVKRCSELVALGLREERRDTPGRNYLTTDLSVLQPLGIGSALSAVVVFGLFVDTPETQIRYATPLLLWFVAVGLIYWQARLWIKTSRGEMHDDPVIYAIKDRGSRIVIAAMMAITIAAHFLTLNRLF